MENGLEILVDFYDPEARNRSNNNQTRNKRGTVFSPKGKKIICYNCGEEGHITPKCPNKKKREKKTVM